MAAKKQQQVDDPRLRWTKNLRAASAALTGAAKRLSGDQTGDLLLIAHAGWTIHGAQAVGLLDRIVKLSEPPFAEWISLMGFWFRPCPEISEDTGGDGSGPGTSPSATTDPSHFGGGDQAIDLVARQEKIDAEIKALLANCLPETNEHNPSSVAFRLVRDLWLYLAPRHRETLSPEAAHAYMEFTPLPEPPWLGRDVDFHKAAWVCSFLADELSRVDDSGWYTEAEAARELGVAAGTVNRLCGRGLRDNQRKGRARRIDPKSVEEVAALRDARQREKSISTTVTSRATSKAQPSPQRYTCTSCGADFDALPRDNKCSKCPSGHVVGVPGRRRG